MIALIASRMRANSRTFTQKLGVPLGGFSVVSGRDSATRRT
jgi:hypothetical protein